MDTSSSPINLYEERQRSQKKEVDKETILFMTIAVLEVGVAYMKWKHFRG